MNTDSLLDESKKFCVLGPDERIWLFAYEPSTDLDTQRTVYFWQAYSKKPGAIFMPEGPWAEGAVDRFLSRHSHRLDSEDKLDLQLFLYLGGLESYFKGAK